MYKSNIKKNKRVLILFLITITISFVNFGQFIWNFNNSIIDTESSTEFELFNELKIADYSPDFSGTGENMNITLHQSYLNNSFNTVLNTSDSNNNKFTLPCPTDTTFNSTYTNITVKEIYAPNRTLIVEDDFTGVAEFLVNNHYLSFNASGVGYIANISLRIYCFDNLDPSNISLALFSAGSDKKPLTNLGTLVSEDVVNDTKTNFYWHNITNINFKYNASDTNHDLFYIRVNSVGGSGLIIDYASDTGVNDQLDESFVYRNDRNTLEYSGILPSNTVDFPLIIDFYPINNTPKPSEIGLKVNNINVLDITYGQGYWESTDVNSSASGDLHYTVYADWWDVTCNVSQVQSNYTKTDLRASSEFNIAGSGQIVKWNVTRDGGLNYFDTDFDNYQINFTIPDTWDETSIRVFNGAVPKTSDSTNRSLGNGYRDVNVLNAGNGTFWYLTAESANLLSSITAYTDSSTPVKFNFTNIAHFNATFSTEITDGLINLIVHSPAAINNLLNYSLTNSSFDAGDKIYFGDWNISDTVIKYGIFRIKLGWNNNTDAGFLEDTITVVADTSLKILQPSPNVIFDANKIFNITISYNDTGQNQYISDADIQYKINNGDYSTVNESVEYIGNGQYNITFDCNNTQFNYGSNNITIKAGGPYYNNQTETINFKILGVTNLTSSIPKSSYNSTETFDISLNFTDTVKDLGIDSATIEVYVNQTLYNPTSINDFLNGIYDITINCSDDVFDSQGYGYFNLSIDVEKSYYNNQTTSDIIIYITGETNITATKFPDPIIGYYNSDETFNITAYFEDIGRNEGINESRVEVYVKEVSASSYDNYSTVSIVEIGAGYYNITIECNNSLFYPYGKFDIKINVTKSNYYTAERILEEIVVGNTTLTILDPTGTISYVENEIFDIKIEYEDHTLSSGITNAGISYTLNSTGYRSDNWIDNLDGTYTITIDAGDTDFGSNYGNLDIIIRANKTNYINLTRTLTFERQIITQLTPPNPPALIEVIRGVSIFYTFNYSDKSGNPIDKYDVFQNTTNLQNFEWYLVNDGGGNYTLELNTSKVAVVETPYTLNFSIYAFGNQSQEISFTILVTIIQTRIEIESWNENADFARSTRINISIDFYYNDTTNDKAITGLMDSDITIKNYYTGTAWSPRFELFDRAGDGNYKLNISTGGVDSGFYKLELNISKYPNHNWSLAYIQFYLRGNYTQIYMVSVFDLEEILTPSGIGNNYTTFVGSDLTLEFNVTDTESGDKVITEEIPGYIIMIAYKNLITELTGTLQENFVFDWNPYPDYGTYIGDILTSELTEAGYYLINITFAKLNYENTTISFNLTLVNSQINIISISNQGGQLEPSGVGNYYNSTVAFDISIEFNITDTESLNRTIARDANSFLVRYRNLGTGQMGTIPNSLAFNLLTSKYIGTLTTSGLPVGNYLINVSVVILNYKIIPLTFNLTIVYANSNVISITNPGGQLTPSIIDNFYDTFIGSNIGIEFNILDAHFGTIIQIGAGISYSVYYQNIDTLESGALQHTITELNSSHSGYLNISQLSVGNYTFSITVEKISNIVSTVDFELRIVEKYETIITIVNKPESINAGLPFTIIIKAEYFNGSVWLPIAGSTITITLFYNNGAGTSQDYYTNSSGEIEIIIPTYSDTSTLNLTIQLISTYYHQGYPPEILDIDIIPIPPGFGFEDILPYLIIAGIAVATVGGSVAIYRGVVVPKKREKNRILTEVKTIFDDAINLEHVLVLYKGSGTCVFFKSFSSEQIDPELISGFISAISSFGKDLVSQEELNEISYGDKMLLLSDGEHIRVALVLSKKASLILRRNLMEFIHAFERTYTDDLPNWRGQLNIFRGAGSIVNKILSTSIILPHEISYEYSTAKALKKPQSRDVLKIANNLMKDSERNFFFIATLLKEATEKTGKDIAEIFMGIKELRDRKILMPIEISTIEAKPISQQEMNLINQKISTLVNLTPEERQKLVYELAQVGPAEREAYFVSLAEQHEIISAPIESKPGAPVIETIKEAKKEIKNLKKIAIVEKKKKDHEKSMKIFQNAAKIALNWELVKESQEINDLIRQTKIEDLYIKMKTLEKEAKVAVKKDNFNEAAQKYRISSKIASEIFKLGVTYMTKEVKRLSNKSKEYEKLV